MTEPVAIMNGRRLNEPNMVQVKAQLLKMLEECDLWTMTRRILQRNLAAHFAIRETRLAPYKPMIKHTIRSFVEEKMGVSKDGVDGVGAAATESTSPSVNTDGERTQESLEEDYDSREDNQSDEDYEDEEADDEDSDYDLSKEVRVPRDLLEEKDDKKPDVEFGNSSARRRVYLNAFERAMILAEPLSEFMGELVQSRTNCMKRVHTYIKENNLRDNRNRQIVVCDDTLRKLLKVENFSNMTLTRLLTDLLYKPEEVGDNRYDELLRECNEKELAAKLERVEEAKRTGNKKRRYNKRMSNDDSDTESKSPKKKAYGIHARRRLSPALTEICGANVMSRQEAVRKIWIYVRQNDLNVKSRIKLDDKLKDVFGDFESISNLEVFRRLDTNLMKL